MHVLGVNQVRGHPPLLQGPAGQVFCSTRRTTALTKETGVKGESRCLPSRTEWRPELNPVWLIIILRYKPGQLQNFPKIQKPSKSEYQCFCLAAHFNIRLRRFYKVQAKQDVQPLRNMGIPQYIAGMVATTLANVFTDTAQIKIGPLCQTYSLSL